MSIPGSGERKPMVMLTSPSIFVFWLCRSVSSTAISLLFCFYILVRPSFVFHSPEFSTVFSPLFFFLLSRSHLSRSFSLVFLPLVLFSFPLYVVFFSPFPPSVSLFLTFPSPSIFFLSSVLFSFLVQYIL